MGLLVDLSPSMKRLHNSGLARGGIGTIRPPDMVVYQCGHSVVSSVSIMGSVKWGGGPIFPLSTVRAGEGAGVAD